MNRDNATEDDLKCPSVVARLKADERKGGTTSVAAVDFIRRTCPCEACVAHRAHQKGLRSAADDLSRRTRRR